MNDSNLTWNINSEISPLQWSTLMIFRYILSSNFSGFRKPSIIASCFTWVSFIYPACAPPITHRNVCPIRSRINHCNTDVVSLFFQSNVMDHHFALQVIQARFLASCSFKYYISCTMSFAALLKFALQYIPSAFLICLPHRRAIQLSSFSFLLSTPQSMTDTEVFPSSAASPDVPVGNASSFVA